MGHRAFLARLATTLAGTALVIYGAIAAVSPLPVGLPLLVLGLIMIAAANPAARPLVRNLRQRWRWFDKVVLAIGKRAPERVRSVVNDTHPTQPADTLRAPRMKRTDAVKLSALLAWSICIFACNEERLLPRCLGALERAKGAGNYVVHVMENGSRDDTARIAREAAARDQRIQVHELTIGDKSNAWNEYVYGVAPSAGMHVFIDGDVRPADGAFEALAAALEASPDAYAAAALPASGRSRKAWSDFLNREHYLSGNLYALRGDTLERFRARGIRLPFGSVGEDGLLSYLLVTDLLGGRDDTHRERIAVAKDAFFEFDSLKANARDLAIYMKRLKRYSLRHFQKQVLYARLKEHGIVALPERIDEIYTAETIARLSPRLDPINYFVDRGTLKRLRDKVAARERIA